MTVDAIQFFAYGMGAGIATLLLGFFIGYRIGRSRNR